MGFGFFWGFLGCFFLFLGFVLGFWGVNVGARELGGDQGWA